MITDDGMDEASVGILVSDFNQHIGKLTRLYPLNCAYNSSSYGLFILQHFGLSLVIQSQNDNHTLFVTSTNNAFHSAKILSSQRAIGTKCRIHSPFIAGHASLQTECECIHATRCVLRDFFNEFVRVLLGVKFGLPRIFEGGIHHANVHQ